jgi:hypothetical protein
LLWNKQHGGHGGHGVLPTFLVTWIKQNKGGLAPTPTFIFVRWRQINNNMKFFAKMKGKKKKKTFLEVVIVCLREQESKFLVWRSKVQP